MSDTQERQDRLEKEWLVLWKSPWRSMGPILMAGRSGTDAFIFDVALPVTGKLVEIRFFDFPYNYPWSPPRWSVSQGEKTLIEWVDYDPWKGAYSPQCPLIMWVDRLIRMTEKSQERLKKYKK